MTPAQENIAKATAEALLYLRDLEWHDWLRKVFDRKQLAAAAAKYPTPGHKLLDKLGSNIPTALGLNRK